LTRKLSVSLCVFFVRRLGLRPHPPPLRTAITGHSFFSVMIDVHFETMGPAIRVSVFIAPGVAYPGNVYQLAPVLSQR
jgi:hypothetical protein